MSGWIKRALVALSVLVTAGILSVSVPAPALAATAASDAAPASTNDPAPGEAPDPQEDLQPDPTTEPEPEPAFSLFRGTGVTTFAQQVAQRAYVKAKRQFDLDVRTHHQRSHRGRHKPRAKRPAPFAHVSRWRSLPERLSIPMQGLQRTARGLDRDRRITFFTGANDTAACLHLRTGRVTRGLCGLTYRPGLDNLTAVYETLVRSVQWFDARLSVYGQSARSVALIATTTAAAPNGTEVALTDADGDGVVDDGSLVLSVAGDAGEGAGGGSCGTVLLPESDPTGRNYSAAFQHGIC